jgi:hypothetical protein
MRWRAAARHHTEAGAEMKKPLILAGAVTVLVLTGCGSEQRPVSTGAVVAAADQRATAAVAATEPEMNCLARSFGLDPVKAEKIDQVRTVYAWVYCHAKHGDTAEVVPAVISLAGPPSVRIPADADNDAEVKRLFPADLRDSAYEEPKSMRDLVARLPGGPPPN